MYFFSEVANVYLHYTMQNDYDYAIRVSQGATIFWT